MKKILIMLCLQLFALNVFAQVLQVDSIGEDDPSLLHDEDLTNYHPNIIPDYFIVGTMTYGRYWDMLYQDDSVIDHYYPAGKITKMNFMKEYIKSSYNITVTVDTIHGYIYSKELIARFQDILDTNRILKKYESLTEPQLFSYLLGIYYSDGYKFTDSIFKITPYLISYQETLYALLRQAGCDKIYTEYMRRGVPDLTGFYFEASPKLCMYFKLLEKEKEELEFSKLIKNKWKEDILKARAKQATKLRELFDE